MPQPIIVTSVPEVDRYSADLSHHSVLETWSKLTNQNAALSSRYINQPIRMQYSRDILVDVFENATEKIHEVKSAE